jgi:hypothetical protein
MASPVFGRAHAGVKIVARPAAMANQSLALSICPFSFYAFSHSWNGEIEAPDVRRAIARDRAIKAVTGYCRSTYLPALTRTEFDANNEANKAALRDAAELDARCFGMVVGGLAKGSRDIQAARSQVPEGLAQLLESAQALDVPSALKPLYPMYASNRSGYNTIEQALDLCEVTDPYHTGLMGSAIDIYHCWGTQVFILQSRLPEQTAGYSRITFLAGCKTPRTCCLTVE